jgi:hypothetical protein
MDNVYKQNVYSLRERCWHKKGEVGQVGEQAESVYGRMKPVEFEKRPFSITIGGKIIESGDFGIVRVSNGEVLVGRTRGRYLLTQPLTYCQMFDANVRQEVETLGFLGTDADKMFITWNLPKIDVYGDEVKTYGFLSVGFDGVYGEHLHVTKVRVVCENTWNAAITDSGRSGGALHSGKHNHTNHERDLALWMEFIQQDAQKHVELHQSLFRGMESMKITKDDARTIFQNVYPFSTDRLTYAPQILIDENTAKSDKEDAKAQESRELAMNLFEGAGIQITPTVWGAFNCVTQLENRRPSKKDDTFSILLGNRHHIMENAMAVATSFLNQKGQ